MPSGELTAARRPGLLSRLRLRVRRPHRTLRFTREGRILVILALCIGAAAINTGNNLLFLLLGWVLSFIIASGVLSEISMRGLRIERRAPTTVAAGDPFEVVLVLHNDKPNRASYALEVEDVAGGRALDKQCFFLKLGPGERAEATYRHAVHQRGVYRIDAARVGTRFPFGLFRKARVVEAVTELLVLPRALGSTMPSTGARAWGEAKVQRRGRRGEFFGLREHRFGDDQRDIHWKSSARRGRLLVREYEDELARRVVLIVDNAMPVRARAAGRGPPGTTRARFLDHELTTMLDSLERAIGTAWGLASKHLKLGWQVELIARGAHVPMAQGAPQEARIGRALAMLTMASPDEQFAAMASQPQDSVLIAPAAGLAANRPRVAAVMEIA